MSISQGGFPELPTLHHELRIFRIFVLSRPLVTALLLECKASLARALCICLTTVPCAQRGSGTGEHTVSGCIHSHKYTVVQGAHFTWILRRKPENLMMPSLTAWSSDENAVPGGRCAQPHSAPSSYFGEQCLRSPRRGYLIGDILGVLREQSKLASNEVLHDSKQRCQEGAYLTKLIFVSNSRWNCVRKVEVNITSLINHIGRTFQKDLQTNTNLPFTFKGKNGQG